MALNFQPERTDGTSLRNNLAAVERHINDDHYVRGFTPGEFVIGGAGPPTFVQIPGGSLRWPAISMPAGADSFANSSWRKPSEWRIGHLRIRYWYTSPAGSTNNFMVQVVVDAIRNGEVLSGTALYAAQAAVAGPAVADTVIRSADIYTTTALGSDDELFSVRVTRVGTHASDTNVNAFHLLYVEVEHIPAVQVSD